MIDTLVYEEAQAEQEAKACEATTTTKRMREASRRGGQTTKDKMGPGHYRAMVLKRNTQTSESQRKTWAAKGGEALKAKYGPDHFKEMARKSVEARQRKREVSNGQNGAGGAQDTTDGIS